MRLEGKAFPFARTRLRATPSSVAPALFASLLVSFAFTGIVLSVLPHPLFNSDYSTVVLDRSNILLGASIARDGQWRFPPDGEVPDKFQAALILYEDRRFWLHHGVDGLSLARALFSNIQAHSVVSGGSTLTMQLIRLSRGNPERTVPEKVVEAVLASVCELLYRKDRIIRLYAAHAPFGGNVVGLEAASWRYFARPADQLSWAEAATLAVLPNSPALIHPGRNRDALREKRNALLVRLRSTGLISREDFRLASTETLPGEPRDLPRDAPHLLDRLRLQNPDHEHTLHTDVDVTLQRSVNAILRRQRARLEGNGIHHAAVLVLDVKTGGVLAYAGNIPDVDPQPSRDDSPEESGGGAWNDMIQARRSTGSLLKPFLYAAQLDAGELLPTQLVVDLPTRFSGFVPENNTRTYSGAVAADEALSRSLNVPAVRNLRSYGLHRFYDLLKNLGMTTLFRPADQYGLTLIIGGSEGTLWDLTHMYADMARLLVQPDKPVWTDGRQYPYSPGAVFLTMQALAQVNRPQEEGAWEVFASSRNLAWKTGTSYGFRDAWAIGVNERYAIGVWAGNASGEGRPDLRGYTVAAPLLFDVVNVLPKAGWFTSPPDLVGVDVCADSGYLAGPNCQRTIRIAVPARGKASQVCPYCRLVHLDPTGRFQTNSSMVPVASLKTENWFVLPPSVEVYYRRNNASYRPLPPFLPGTKEEEGQLLQTGGTVGDFALLFPDQGGHIYVPIDLDGTPGMTVFQASHRDPSAVLYWHLDGDYLGSTREIHQMEARPGPGPHRLVLMDKSGQRVERTFTVLSK